MVSFNLFTTDFEPPSVSYSEMFSWKGERFPKRPNQNPRIVYRRKRSLFRMTDLLDIVPDANLNSKFLLVPEEGVLVIAESVAILDEYLQGSPRDPFRRNRRIFIIVVTNASEPDFDIHAEMLLAKLWHVYAIADAILITPCKNDPEVSLTRRYSSNYLTNKYCSIFMICRLFKPFSHSAERFMETKRFMEKSNEFRCQI